MVLTKAEQETHLWAAADEDHWIVFTEDKKMITLMKNRGWDPTSKKGESYWYMIPRKAISVRSKKSVMNPKKRGKGGLNK